jgi:hypothetical protein
MVNFPARQEGVTMRSLKLTLSILCAAATLLAADPFAGTWKMNAAKSKYKVGAAPKEQTITIMEMGADLHVMVSGTAADGSKIAMNYTVPAKGGPGKITEPAAYDGVTSKRISPNEREISYTKAGKVQYTAHSKVAADGKSLTVHAKGTTALGKEVDGDVAYDREK